MLISSVWMCADTVARFGLIALTCASTDTPHFGSLNTPETWEWIGINFYAMVLVGWQSADFVKSFENAVMRWLRNFRLTNVGEIFCWCVTSEGVWQNSMVRDLKGLTKFDGAQPQNGKRRSANFWWCITLKNWQNLMVRDLKIENVGRRKFACKFWTNYGQKGTWQILGVSSLNLLISTVAKWS